MFINKILSRESGILTYGITPPKQSGATPQRIAEIAAKTIARIKSLNIDALVVYDVQDESSRTSVERPFPYITALDPFEFASAYLHDLHVPKIIYRPAGKFSPAELMKWMDDLRNHKFYPVFVGVPAPGFTVKTTLKEAYSIWSSNSESSVLGAVTIPERHAASKDEDKRILDKASCGVSYFISQCVFNIDYATKLIEDLGHACKQQTAQTPAIIFTLTACGSCKTLEFMDWLGIHLPEDMKEDLKNADNMLDASVKICLDIAEKIIVLCKTHCIPFGFNIESVAIRKDEIEASVFMLNRIGEMLQAHCLRDRKTMQLQHTANISTATDPGQDLLKTA